MYLSKFLGSSLSLPAHGWVGARATSFLAAHFALRNTDSERQRKKAKAGKRRGGIPPRPPFRPAGIKLKRSSAVSAVPLGGTPKQNNFQNSFKKILRAGFKKMKEICFALLGF